MDSRSFDYFGSTQYKFAQDRFRGNEKLIYVFYWVFQTCFGEAL